MDIKIDETFVSTCLKLLNSISMRSKKKEGEGSTGNADAHLSTSSSGREGDEFISKSISNTLDVKMWYFDKLILHPITFRITSNMNFSDNNNKRTAQLFPTYFRLLCNIDNAILQLNGLELTNSFISQHGTSSPLILLSLYLALPPTPPSPYSSLSPLLSPLALNILVLYPSYSTPFLLSLHSFLLSFLFPFLLPLFFSFFAFF